MVHLGVLRTTAMFGCLALKIRHDVENPTGIFSQTVPVVMIYIVIVLITIVAK